MIENNYDSLNACLGVQEILCTGEVLNLYQVKTLDQVKALDLCYTTHKRY